MAHVQKTSPWTYTGLQAQNLGTGTVAVTMDYYNSSGGASPSSLLNP
jgi:hypothetical protein